MEYRRLGQTELRVSAVGFGTCQLRLVPEKQAIDTLIRGFELGVNFVHTAPDYEGAEDLVAHAIRETSREVLICTQAYDVHGNACGPVNHFERLFEASCKRFERERLELFGIACIDDREAFGENVWGRNGMVEFLQKKKEEGRIGATYCTTHGDVGYIKKLIDSEVFDALMLAYNPLGFHLLSYCPPKGRSFENLSRTRLDIFPLARERGFGLIIMKPLAGGLLCNHPGIPMRKRIFTHSGQLTASEILRSILTNKVVNCVLVGTTSVPEAEENAMAGHSPLIDSAGVESRIKTGIRQLQTSICSRCGACDELCSKKLPVSWLFRAAYISLHPLATFETWDEVEYFQLHPLSEPVCATCDDITCRCAYGIDIPESLLLMHGQMMKHLERGIVRPPVSDWTPPIGNAKFSARMILKNVPSMLSPGESYICRLCVENSGSWGWIRAKHPNQQMVSLLILYNGRTTAELPVRHTVHNGGRTHFAFELKAPMKKSKFHLGLVLAGKERRLSRQKRLLLHDGEVEVRGRH